MKLFVAQTGIITIAASTGPITLLQVTAAAAYPLRLREIGFTIDDLDSGDELPRFDLLRQTTAGTMTPLAAGSGLNKLDASDGTIQATAQHTATAEPTAGEVVRTWLLGHLVYVLPDPIVVAGGARLGLRYTSDTPMAATKCACHMVFEE